MRESLKFLERVSLLHFSCDELHLFTGDSLYIFIDPILRFGNPLKYLDIELLECLLMLGSYYMVKLALENWMCHTKSIYSWSYLSNLKRMTHSYGCLRRCFKGIEDVLHKKAYYEMKRKHDLLEIVNL